MIDNQQLQQTDHAVVSIRLDLDGPMEMGEFVRAMTGIAMEYRQFVREEFQREGQDAKIYIKEFRKGSTIADLIPYGALMAQSLTFADNMLIAEGFVRSIGQKFRSMSNALSVRGQYNRQELDSFHNIVGLIATDKNGSAAISSAKCTKDGNSVTSTFEFNAQQAHQVQRIIDAEYEHLEAETHVTHERVLMIFTRTDSSHAKVDRRSGEKVTISEISERTLPVIYASGISEEQIRHEIKDAEDNVYKKGFVVDVAVQRRNGKPIAYKILHLHDVIDLPDDAE